MLKFLRKHAKTLMVTLGSLLMLVFLLPAGGQFLMPDQSNPVIATAGGREFDLQAQRQAAEDLETFRMWVGMSRQGFAAQIELFTMPTEAHHWMLLLHEARMQGVDVSVTWANSRASEIWKTNDYAFGKMMQSRNIPLERFARMLRHAEIINRYKRFVTTPTATSEPRLRRHAWENRSELTVERIALSTGAVAGEVPEPTPAELKAHFEQYKDTAPGQSKPFGFGYRHPHQLQLEYLAVELEPVLNQFKGRLNKRVNGKLTDEAKKLRVELAAEIKRRYEANVQAKKIFLNLAVDDPQTPDEKDKKPADSKDEKKETDKTEAKPEEPKAKTAADYDGKPYKDVPYLIAESVLRKQVLEDRAEKIQEEIISRIQARVYESIRHLPQKDGYRVLDEKYKPVDFQKLADQIEQQFKVRIRTVHDERWREPKELRNEEGIGTAWIDNKSSRRIFFTDYLSATRQLLPKGAEPPLNIPKIQKGIPSSVLVDDQGNRYVFRATDTREPSAPESLDQVRDQVEKDVRRLKAYRHLEKIADTLLGWARDKGLSSVAESFKIPVDKPAPFNRQATQFNEAFRDELFDLAESVREAGGLDQADPRRLYRLHLDPASTRLELVHITDYQPIDEVTYRDIKRDLFSELMRPSGGFMNIVMMPPSLQLEPLKKRLNFKLEGVREDEEDPAAESVDIKK